MTLDDLKKESSKFYHSEQEFFKNPLKVLSYKDETAKITAKMENATGRWKKFLKRISKDFESAETKLKIIRGSIMNRLPKGQIDIFMENWIENINNQKKLSPPALKSIFDKYHALNSMIRHLGNSAFSCGGTFLESIYGKNLENFTAIFNDLVVPPKNQNIVGKKGKSQLIDDIGRIPSPGDNLVEILKDCFNQAYNTYFNRRQTIYEQIKNMTR